MSTPNSKVVARVALGILVASVVLAPFIAGNHQDQVQLDRLRRVGVVATGHITGKECQNHGAVRYTYVADNHTLHGFGSCPVGCATAQIGDPLPVIYSPGSLFLECKGFSELQGSINSNRLGLLFIGCFLVFFVFRLTARDFLSSLDGR